MATSTLSLHPHNLHLKNCPPFSCEVDRILSSKQNPQYGERCAPEKHNELSSQSSSIPFDSISRPLYDAHSFQQQSHKQIICTKIGRPELKNLNIFLSFKPFCIV
ncbi:hypothetical protein O6H91_01G168600 [Diphasiastrum complanatum]|uniref:Uncharacterized protein n=1 Tax=Diphasiastrum complanatum TaxID=34168 RepID=A0ACC2EYH5_DIPCM|nr:hypothetical protein O6H91_01G168600 [Diphasiastrum complanatum]